MKKTAAYFSRVEKHHRERRFDCPKATSRTIRHLLVLIVLFVFIGCAQTPDISPAVAKVAPQAPPTLTKDSWTPILFKSYLMKTNMLMIAVAPPDRREATEIWADLEALPKEQLYGLRKYILTEPNWPAYALVLMEKLLPDNHKEYLIEALDANGWMMNAVRYLVDMDDPTVVEPILSRVEYSTSGVLNPIAKADNPAFLEEVLKFHTTSPTSSTARLLGLFGGKAENEVRACAASDKKYFRHGAIQGLSASLEKSSLPLLLDLVDFSNGAERQSLAKRFITDGEEHVEKLITWLDGTPEQASVAYYALPRINSDRGVSFVLEKFNDSAFDNGFAGKSASSSTKASREFIVDNIDNGTSEQMMNALLVAHHLLSSDQPERGKEHPLLKSFMKATFDKDDEVRREALSQMQAYASDGHYPEGQKALHRLIELFDDPSSRVRSEAVVQASQYPCAEVLELIKIIAEKETDERARDSMKHTATFMEGQLRGLAGRGSTPVFLSKK